MTNTEVATWEAMRTAETRGIEGILRQAGFARVEAYRYNPAVIRVRVIDPRFEKLTVAERDALVDVYLEQLPEFTQGDITTLLTFAPSELQETIPLRRGGLMNLEFDAPSPSEL